MKVNKKVLAGAGLLAAALVGGTFAYFNETLFIDNPLDTGNYNTVLYEEFKPTGDGEELKPGQHWTKEVGAKNTGDYPVLVRIKMSESWARQDNQGNLQSPYKELDSVLNKDKFLAKSEQLTEDLVFTANQVSQNPDEDADTDGYVTEEDDTVVHKHLLDNSGWVDGGDGYWYWNGVLEKAGSGRDKTNLIMDELILATNVDMGYYEDKEYYCIQEKEPGKNDPDVQWILAPSDDILAWVTTEQYGGKSVEKYLKENPNQKLWRKSESKVYDDTRKGYSDSVYTLLITSDFVQATKDAVKAAWGDEGANIVDDKLNNIIVDGTDSVNYINDKGTTLPLKPGDFEIIPPTEGETSPAGSEPAAP